MRILILGAGAIGSVVGGLMQQAGHEVVLVGRKAHMSAIREHGLRVCGIWGDHTISGMKTATSIAEAQTHTPFDFIVLTVKAFDTAAVMREASPLCGTDTCVCAYQNGLGNAEAVAEVVGWKRTLCARAIYGVVLDQPGHVRVTVIAQPTAIGVYHASFRTPERDARARDLAEAMNAAGLPTIHADNVAQVLWAKVAYNCALNPLSALLDVPYGALAESEDTRAIMDEVIDETYAVAGAEKIALAPATAEAYRGVFYDEMLPPTANHYASMHEDLRRARKTEIDALNGAVVRLGEKHGIACPANAFLARMIRAHETLHKT